MKISKRTGSEGPRHDPYGYDRLTFKKGGVEIVAHSGLGEWLTVGGEKRPFSELVALAGKTFNELLEIEEVQNAPPTVCPKCGGELSESTGYVGETIEFCDNDKCDQGITWSADPQPYCE